MRAITIITILAGFILSGCSAMQYRVGMAYDVPSDAMYMTPVIRLDEDNKTKIQRLYARTGQFVKEFDYQINKRSLFKKKIDDHPGKMMAINTITGIYMNSYKPVDVIIFFDSDYDAIGYRIAPAGKIRVPNNIEVVRKLTYPRYGSIRELHGKYLRDELVYTFPDGGISIEHTDSSPMEYAALTPEEQARVRKKEMIRAEIARLEISQPRENGKALGIFLTRKNDEEKLPWECSYSLADNSPLSAEIGVICSFGNFTFSGKLFANKWEYYNSDAARQSIIRKNMALGLASCGHMGGWDLQGTSCAIDDLNEVGVQGLNLLHMAGGKNEGEGPWWCPLAYNLTFTSFTITGGSIPDSINSSLQQVGNKYGYSIENKYGPSFLYWWVADTILPAVRGSDHLATIQAIQSAIATLYHLHISGDMETLNELYGLFFEHLKAQGK